jgi:double-stranded uracil-DNA glycosylase
MSHRVTQEWMGEHVETLEDLLRPGLRAICIGINPALKSAAAGHYYQGTLGQRFFERLQNADPLPRESGWEDDLGFENGIGFTDIVKRPTRSATEVRPSDFVHGRELLRAKIEAVQPQLVIFTFKKTANAFFGPIAGTGPIQGLNLSGAPVFVMPGPFRPRNEVQARLGQLRAMLE